LLFKILKSLLINILIFHYVMQTSLPFSRNSSLTDIPHILLYQRHIDPITIRLGKQLTLSSLIEVVSGNKKFKKIRLFDHKG
jgi:hypothetical protein